MACVGAGAGGGGAAVVGAAGLSSGRTRRGWWCRDSSGCGGDVAICSSDDATADPFSMLWAAQKRDLVKNSEALLFCLNSNKLYIQQILGMTITLAMYADAKFISVC